MRPCWGRSFLQRSAANTQRSDPCARLVTACPAAGSQPATQRKTNRRTRASGPSQIKKRHPLADTTNPHTNRATHSTCLQTFSLSPHAKKVAVHQVILGGDSLGAKLHALQDFTLEQGSGRVLKFYLTNRQLDIASQNRWEMSSFVSVPFTSPPLSFSSLTLCENNVNVHRVPTRMVIR